MGFRFLIAATAMAMAMIAAPGHAQAQGGHGMHGHMGPIMPGTRGANVSDRESAEMTTLFRHFRSLSREVTNLPNGIKTVTRSSNPQVMEALISHVIGMRARVDAGDDPQVFIQSPTLEIFFERRDALDTRVEVSDDGITVFQTSEDPELVAALQAHAAEVTGMVDQGMRAVHQRMMQQHR